MDFQGLLLPGTKFGGITVDRQRGGDSSGELYDAILDANRMRVLVRVLNPSLSVDGPPLQNLLGMLNRYATCKSPHLAQMVAMDQTAAIQRWILVTSFGNANSLAERVQMKNLTAPAVVMIMRQALTALGQAHAAGFLHGNLNLDNLALTLDGKVKILNFAFAELSLADRKANGDFQAPELLNGGAPDCSTDLYALGMVFLKLFQAVGIACFPVEVRRVAERMSTQSQATRFQTVADAQKMLGAGAGADDLNAAKETITRTFERTRTIQLQVDTEIQQAKIREKLPRPFTIAIVAALAALIYLKVVPLLKGKNLAQSSLTLVHSAVDAGKKVTGVTRALEAKEAAIEMKKSVEEAEARKLSSADLAAEGDDKVPPVQAPASH